MHDSGKQGAELRAETPAQARVLTFGPFEFDESRHELRREGRPVRLHLQPARLLALLLRNAGRIVTRSEIRQRVWAAGTFVDFDQGINHCIRQLRTALGDTARASRYISTLPRHGYRFVAPVRARDARSEGAPTPVALFPRRPRFRGSAVSVVATLACAAALASGIWVVRRATLPAAPRLLVVLPFENLSGDGDGWLGDALTEELISRLGQRFPRGFGVIARTSSMHYKGASRPVDEIGRELGVDYVLEGSVRRQGERLRITAQLVRAADQMHLWAANYDREPADLLDVQVEVCDKIAQALALKLLPAGTARSAGGRTSARAYALYLEGRRASGRGPEGFRRRLELLREAVAEDPGFAPAWVALAQASLRRPLPARERGDLAGEALQQALALDDSLAEAHYLSGQVSFYHRWDFEGARREWERAIRLRPSYAEAYHALAAWYSIHERHDEALALVRQALALDPMSPQVLSDVGWYHYFARRYDEAVEHSEAALEKFPTFYWAHRCILFAHLQRGDLDRAAAQARREMRAPRAETKDMPSSATPSQVLRAYWTWDRGRKLRAEEAGWGAPAALAEVQIWQGDPEGALASLERSVRLRAGWVLPFLGVAPMFDPLRDDPRFHDLVATVLGPARRTAGRLDSRGAI